MYYSGFADEAGADIDTQIKATIELGWNNIESRNIDGVNITDITEEKFEEVVEKLEKSGVKINCFGSAVANWAKHPRKEEDFQKSIDELKRAIIRMKHLGTKMIRAMSFTVPKDETPDSPELEKIIFKKVNKLVKMCEDEGLIYLHENCMNYGGMSYMHTLKLLDYIKSPAFKLVFDTGNPPFTYNIIGNPPYSKQDSFEFYKNVKEFIYYVHIKDAIYLSESDGLFPNAKFIYPGEGDGKVIEIVKDLLQSGYDGGFSIEPHMALVIHDKDKAAADEIKYSSYVEYGKRFMKIVKDLGY